MSVPIYDPHVPAQREPVLLRIWRWLDRPITFLDVLGMFFALGLYITLLDERTRELLWRALPW